MAFRRLREASAALPPLWGTRMSGWYLVTALVLVTLLAAFAIAEWLARRYTIEIRRRIEPYAGEREQAAGDPFDDDRHAAG